MYILDLNQSGFAVLDIVTEAWIYPSSMWILKRYIDAKRSYKLLASASAKAELSNSGRELKPYLLNLREDIRNKEKNKMRELFRIGKFDIKGCPIFKAQLKAIEHMLSKLK